MFEGQNYSNTVSSIVYALTNIVSPDSKPKVGLLAWCVSALSPQHTHPRYTVCVRRAAPTIRSFVDHERPPEKGEAAFLQSLNFHEESEQP
eukprot:359469-Chlamydomonas_euryale.AAC.18